MTDSNQPAPPPLPPEGQKEVNRSKEDDPEKAWHEPVEQAPTRRTGYPFVIILVVGLIIVGLAVGLGVGLTRSDSDGSDHSDDQGMQSCVYGPVKQEVKCTDSAGNDCSLCDPISKSDDCKMSLTVRELL